MPTSTRGGNAAPPPVTPNPVAPNNRPVGPHVAPPPPEKPDPVLAKVGFNHGGVQEFNKRVDAAVQAHVQATGTKPSKALVMDIVRSPVDPSQYGNLFRFPTPDRAQAHAAVQADKQRNPDNYFVTRPDGVVQPDTPMYRLIRNTQPEPVAPTDRATLGANPPKLTPADRQENLAAKYPMVVLGALPVAGADHVYNALNLLNASANQGAQPPDPAAEKALSAAQQLDTQKIARAKALGQPVPEPDLALAQRREAVRTVKQAQAELNREMGTSLPETGFLNDTWVKTLSNWMRTGDYFRSQLRFQAQDAGFGNNVDAYVKAWKSKQDTLKKHPALQHFLAAMPLGLYAHGGVTGTLEALPAYLKGSSNNPLNIGLHGLTRTAGLTLDTIGGTVQQGKATLAAGNAFAHDILPPSLAGKGRTFEEAKRDAKKTLVEHPSWLRVLLGSDLPEHPHGALKVIDDATNIVGDLVLLRKANFTGERVAAGDLGAARNSAYLNAASHWAYQDLAKYGRDGVGRAAARLESGAGARALVSYTAPLVKRGRMSEEQFANHVAELYANGRTTVPLREGAEREVTGPLLNTLRNNRLPAPGTPDRAWLRSKAFTRGFLDDFDNSARRSNLPGSTLAADFTASIRSAVSHATATRLGTFDEALPERVFNYVVKHKLGDDTMSLANKLESDLVRFQGRQNVVGIQRVQETLRKLYHEKYPGRPEPQDPFEARLSTEAPSVFKFPGGGEREIDSATSAIDESARKINGTLNRLAVIHSRIILSGLNPLSLVGGFSLFWKHAIGDTLRAEVGGGGVLVGLDNDVRRAKQEIRAFADSDPEASRRLGAFMQRAVMGETRWLLNRGGSSVMSKSFETGEKFGKANYMDAAGGYLRRHLDDPALDAYRSGNLTDFVLHDRHTRGLWKAARRRDPELTAEDYAQQTAERYAAIESALDAQGLTWDDALAALRANRGAKADKALGKFISKNNVDFGVYKALVENRGTFDDLTGRWIGNVIMRPNKWNRGRFAENVMAKTYAELRKAGWDKPEALDTAISVGGTQAKYHMLDFANRLQVEQNLRWLSYFATKHRLYWKWVMGTFVRRPGIAAAVDDIRQHLDDSGSIPVRVGGFSLRIPAARLVWVPGREYDETSPLALGVYNFLRHGGGVTGLEGAVSGAAGTNGNIITRSDTAVLLGAKALRAKTYGEATAGLDPKTARQVNRAINDYQTTYFHEHGHYAAEADAVQHVLWHQLAREYWRANLPLPVLPDDNRGEQHQLMGEYMTLVDPKAKRKFFDDHPGFQDQFGVYDNPATNLHVDEFFRKYQAAHDAYFKARGDIYDELRAGTEDPTKLLLEKRAIDDRFRKLYQRLLLDDALKSGRNVPDDVKARVERGGDYNGPKGTWGKVIAADPQIDPNHALNALFPNLKTDGHVIGLLQRDLRRELANLNDPEIVKTFAQPDEVRQRRQEILQALDAFRGYPTDALGKVQLDYQRKHVGPYFKESDAKYQALKKLPSDQQDAAWASYRAWRDAQDHPVVVDGVKFPSPVRMAWATLPPELKQQRLAKLANSSFDHLADYELDLLGVKHPPNVSTALAAIEQAKVAYAKANPGKHVNAAQLNAVAKQIDRQPGYGGFYAYYRNTLTQPKIARFEQTSVYRDMPAAYKDEFDRYIAQPAQQIAKLAAKSDGDYYRAEWRKAVDEQVRPWLNNPENKGLKRYLDQFGPDFLNTLVSQ